MLYIIYILYYNNIGELAKKVLVRANMRLVFHIARYYRYRGVAYPDLVQEGTTTWIDIIYIYYLPLDK